MSEKEEFSEYKKIKKDFKNNIVNNKEKASNNKEQKSLEDLAAPPTVPKVF